MRRFLISRLLRVIQHTFRLPNIKMRKASQQYSHPKCQDKVSTLYCYWTIANLQYGSLPNVSDERRSCNGIDSVEDIFHLLLVLRSVLGQLHSDSLQDLRIIGIRHLLPGFKQNGIAKGSIS